MSPGVISSPSPVRADSPVPMPQNGPGSRGNSTNSRIAPVMVRCAGATAFWATVSAGAR